MREISECSFLVLILSWVALSANRVRQSYSYQQVTDLYLEQIVRESLQSFMSLPDSCRYCMKDHMELHENLDFVFTHELLVGDLHSLQKVSWRLCCRCDEKCHNLCKFVFGTSWNSLMCRWTVGRWFVFDCPSRTFGFRHHNHWFTTWWVARPGFSCRRAYVASGPALQILWEHYLTAENSSTWWLRDRNWAQWWQSFCASTQHRSIGWASAIKFHNGSLLESACNGAQTDSNTDDVQHEIFKAGVARTALGKTSWWNLANLA